MKAKVFTLLASKLQEEKKKEYNELIFWLKYFSKNMKKAQNHNVLYLNTPHLISKYTPFASDAERVSSKVSCHWTNASADSSWVMYQMQRKDRKQKLHLPLDIVEHRTVDNIVV